MIRSPPVKQTEHQTKAKYGREAMREILEQMTVRRQMREKIYVELAKLYEHYYRNPQRALRYADLASKYIPPAEKDALDRRRRRLMNKLEKQHGGKFNGIL